MFIKLLEGRISIQNSTPNPFIAWICIRNDVINEGILAIRPTSRKRRNGVGLGGDVGRVCEICG